MAAYRVWRRIPVSLAIVADEPGPREQAGRDVRLGVRLGGRLVIAALSFITLVGSGLAWATYQNFTAHVPHGAPVPKLDSGHHDVDGSDQNILLLGNDSRAGASPAELNALGTQDDGGSVNTDTMILVHIPADGRKATAVSFPRDSWVTIPGCSGRHKLNSAYINGATDCGTTTADPDRGRREAGADDQRAVRAEDRPLRRGRPARLLPDHQGHRRRPGLPQPGPEGSGPLLGDRPAQGHLDDRGQAGAGVRPAAARAAPWRPGPDRPPAVLHVGDVPEGDQPRRAHQPDQAEAAARRGRQLDADGLRPRPDPAGRPAARAGRRQRHVHHDPDRGQRRPQRPGRHPRRRVGDPAVLRVGDQPAEADVRGEAGRRAAT